MADENKKIPDFIIQRTNQETYIDKLEELVKKYNLQEDQARSLAIFGRNLLLDQVVPQDIVERLKDLLNLDDESNKKFAIDFIGTQLLPLQDYLVDVRKILEDLGGKPQDYMQEINRLLLPEKLFWNNVAIAWGDADFVVDEVDSNIRKNYFNILISYLLSKIKGEDLTSAMVVSPSSGGVGVTAEQAEIISEWTQNLVDTEDISLDDFRKLDEIRKQILGPEIPSLLETTPVDLTASDPELANGLLGQTRIFLSLPEIKQTMDQVSGFKKETGYDAIKISFYEAINNKDRVGFISALAKMFSSGQVKGLFEGDERYVKFWRNRILKDKGLDGVRKFDENPLRREQFGSFLKHVMEERFEIPTSDAVLWGVFFSSLAHRAGDADYDRLAYGDLNDQQFKWNF